MKTKYLGAKETGAENGNASFFSSDPKGKAANAGAESFRARLEEICEEAGGPSKLGRSAGMRESTIRNWLKGPSEPNRAKLVAISSAAGVSVAWLATGEGPKYRAESGAGSGEEPATSGEQGDSGSQDADRKACMCEQAEAATIPSVDLFWDMAAVTKALVRMFTRDQILDLDAANLSDRIQLAYHLVKCTSSRPENSQKE